MNLAETDTWNTFTKSIILQHNVKSEFLYVNVVYTKEKPIIYSLVANFVAKPWRYTYKCTRY